MTCEFPILSVARDDGCVCLLIPTKATNLGLLCGCRGDEVGERRGRVRKGGCAVEIWVLYGMDEWATAWTVLN
jgi:hypothetical protein